MTMATKRLGRSIIELGRGKHGKYERKQIARGARRNWRLDQEGEHEAPKKPAGWGRELRDNLRPLDKWLRSHVGQKWDKVYSEFLKKVDTRDLQGDHIHRHLLEMVAGSGGKTGISYRWTKYEWDPPCEDLHGYWAYFVGHQGLLYHHSRRKDREDCWKYSSRYLGWDRKKAKRDKEEWERAREAERKEAEVQRQAKLKKEAAIEALRQRLLVRAVQSGREGDSSPR